MIKTAAVSQKAIPNKKKPCMRGAAVSSTADPLFRQSVSRLAQAKEQAGTLSASRQRHSCTVSLCQPESEPMLSSFLGNALTCNVFMCRLGSIHLCTADECRLYVDTPNSTCPISGMHFGQIVSNYDKNDYRTYRNPNAAQQSASTNAPLTAQMLLQKTVTTTTTSVSIVERPMHAAADTKVSRRRRKHKLQLTTEQVQNYAQRLVMLLLYSPQRRHCIESMRLRFHRQAEDAVMAYTKRQTSQSEGQLPYASDMYRIRAQIASRPTPLQELMEDKALVHYYTCVIEQVWDLVQRYHVPLNQKRYDADDGNLELVPRINFDAVSLGVLYIMRKGVRHHNAILLPADDFLLMQLPNINILNEFGLEKSLVTEGDKIISGAYHNAFAEGVALSQVTLDVDKIPRYETARIEHTDVGAVKMSSSGEKLFMPSSRLKK